MYERLTLNLVAAHRTCLVVSVFRVSRLLSHVPVAFTIMLVPCVMIAYTKVHVNMCMLVCVCVCWYVGIVLVAVFYDVDRLYEARSHALINVENRSLF